MSAWDVLYILVVAVCLAVLVTVGAIVLSVGRTFITSTDDDPFADDRAERGCQR